jgi:hypothetical protein
MMSFSLYGSLMPNKWYYIYKVTTETGFEDYIMLTTTLRHTPGNDERPPGLSYRGAIPTDSNGRIISLEQVCNEFTYTVKDRFWDNLREVQWLVAHIGECITGRRTRAR